MKMFYTIVKRGRTFSSIQAYTSFDTLMNDLQWACRTFGKFGDYIPELCSYKLLTKKIENGMGRFLKVADLKDSCGEFSLYVSTGTLVVG